MTEYYTDVQQIEKKALESLRKFEEDEHIEKICVFPDIHYCAERAIPVGVAFKTSEVFYPLVTGKDMGCGVAYMALEKRLMQKPFDKKHYRALEKAHYQMTDEGLGGGNHFLALEEDSNFVYIVVHTGSRNLGIYMYQKNYGLIQEHNPGKEWLPIELATLDYISEYYEVLEYAVKRRAQFLNRTFDFLVRNGYFPENARTSPSDSIHNLLDFSTDSADKLSVIHRKGATRLMGDEPAVIPLSMSRGSLIVRANKWDRASLENALDSCSHGAGRLRSRTDTLKHWHSMKKSEKEAYKAKFPEWLEKNGEFENGVIQEFDFAYKDSSTILSSQPYLIPVTKTSPIVTVKFTAI